MTTLCYIEKDDSYLMMHRTVKKNDVNKDKWIGVAGTRKRGKVRRTACCGKWKKRRDCGWRSLPSAGW